MNKLGEIFEKEITPSIIKSYYEAIKEITDEQFIRAMKYLIQNHKFKSLPIPHDIHEAVKMSRPADNPDIKQITSDGVPCPPEVKKQMEELMEKIKMKRMK